ncbi:hypothetical protein FN846DRAFT_889002 [Sphaerosporella brunnea]|uniref:FAD-binding PCMH-type domain-containing protein n=1 Tax=Sphaerosporella brunnea TaxID=1250544 RepID=A0A5J5F0L3_9PEZI|nr:hypothetical protein FN846DRAFT_889002 [Sphaerosporella brunnea]
MGAGVQGFEALQAAAKQGLRVVTGSSLTVGIAGGYTQALEWDVVTPTGEPPIATPSRNVPLYWALSGGGGGTYGVAISMTAKAHPDGVVSGAGPTFTSTNVSEDAFWEAVEAFQATVPNMAANRPTFKERVEDLYQPFINELKKRGIAYTLNAASFPTYIEHFNHYYGPLPYGTTTSVVVIGSRLIRPW